MEDEQKPERGFTVVDRRDEAREAEAEATPDLKSVAAPEAQPEAPPFAASDAGSAAAADKSAPPLPPVDFSSFAISLASSALYHLGMVADPQAGTPGEKNLPLARHTIDTIELLQQKTAGNLTDDEAKLIGNLLAELRMHFVEASRN